MKSLFCSASLLLVTACARSPARQKIEISRAEPAVAGAPSQSAHTVPLTLRREQVGNGSLDDWQATFNDGGRSAGFRISFRPSKQIGESGISSGEGVLSPLAGSDGTSFLSAMRKALEADSPVAPNKKPSPVAFTYARLGDHMSRVPSGGFSEHPPGQWTALKLFLPDKEDPAEVFFNLNATTGEAEFSEKDPDFGDAVLRALSKVF